MRQPLFLIGALSGFVCGLAMILEPLPDRGGLSQETLVRIPDAVYRMDGVITQNTCPLRPVPWPHLWSFSGEELRIGDEIIRARFLRAAAFYEAVRISRDGCTLATWSIKLVPQGAGVRGSASWEVRARDDAGGGCAPPAGLPCMVEADILGLPENGVVSEIAPR